MIKRQFTQGTAGCQWKIARVLPGHESNRLPRFSRDFLVDKDLHLAYTLMSSLT